MDSLRNAEIDADKDGGWGVYAIRELGAGNEIMLGWEWDDAHPIHWRGREARSRRRLGGSIHDMCMRRQDMLCTRGDAQRRLEGWQSRPAGREAERIQDQGQGAGWHRDCTRKGKTEAKGSGGGGLAGEERDRTSRRSTPEDEERSRKNAHVAIAIKPNRRICSSMSPILRTEDPTISPLTHDVLTSPVPPALKAKEKITLFDAGRRTIRGHGR